MFYLIKIENIFDKFCENIYIIEYQKHGFLDIYFLIFFNSVYKFLEAYYIEEVICAKLSIIEADQTGEFITIMTLEMLHSLYREINLNSSYISNT